MAAGAFWRDFMIAKRLVYMNNGAIAPTPRTVVGAVAGYLSKCAEEGPDSARTSEYTASLVRKVRQKVARLINCEPDEVVLTQSTTDGINMVANGIPWKRGDAIVARGGRHEHYANYLPWLRLSQRGVSLKELAIDGDGFFDMGDLEEAAKGSRLVAMSHALYNTGAIMPLEEVGRIARRSGALFCVDAAQSAGTVEIDVKKIGCHFMAFPAFKWICGPTGIGIFYCNKKAAELLEPPSIGGESATLGDGRLAYLEMPARLQAGFRNFAGAAGLDAALRYVLGVGIGRIRRRNMKVAEALRQEAGRLPGVRLHGPDGPARRTSIVSFTTPKDPSYMVRKLEEKGIVLAARDIGNGKKAVRASPHFFNTEQEAASVAAQVRRLL